jgi:hypothetical protein
LLADIDEFVTELLVITELGDFLFGLAHRSRSGQGLGDGFAAPFVGKAQARSMAGIVGLGAVAGWFPTAPHRADDGAGAHVIETRDRAEQFCASSLQCREGFWHGLPF